MVVFQQTLTIQISESLDKATEKLDREFSALAERLEGRISRARADHETMIGDQQRRQDRFQAKIRVALESLKTGELARDGLRVGEMDEPLRRGEAFDRRGEDYEEVKFGGGYRGRGR